MKVIFVFVLVVFICACAAKQSYVNDVNASRVTFSNITHLARVINDGSYQDVAVLIATEDNGEKFIAIAPELGASPKRINSINYGLIKSFKIDDVPEFMRVLRYASQNYDKNLAENESINANYIVSRTSPINESVEALRGYLTFSFVRIGSMSFSEIVFDGTPPSRILLSKKDISNIIETLEIAMKDIKS